MKINKLSTLALALLVSSPLVYANMDHAGKKMSADQKIERLAKELDLTPEQRAQIDPIVREGYDKKSKTADKTDKKRAKEQMHERINAVLTAEQRVRFAEMNEDHQKGDKGTYERVPSTGPMGTR